jgi:hypothetical protein
MGPRGGPSSSSTTTGTWATFSSVWCGLPSRGAWRRRLEEKLRKTEEALIDWRKATEGLTKSLADLTREIETLPAPSSEVEDARQAGAPVAAPPGADDEVRGALKYARGVGVAAEDLELDTEAPFFR